MNTNDLFHDAITVPATQVVHLSKARGQRIESVSGQLWITLDGDPRDIILEPGEGFVVDRDTEVLISALHHDARFVRLEPTSRSNVDS